MKDKEVTFYCEDCDLEFTTFLSRCEQTSFQVHTTCSQCDQPVFTDKDEVYDE